LPQRANHLDGAAMRKRFPATALAIAFIAVNVVGLFFLQDWMREGQARSLHGPVIYETVSDFSHIRVREKDSLRGLFFVDPEGQEQRQSAIDLDHPEELQLGYSRSIFISLLFRRPQEQVLIVGLGGGGMVRFLNQKLPETQVDAVEIDPVVVKIAADYFGTDNGPNTSIYTEDAFVFLKEPHGPYDVIYMDAFLKPPTESGLKELQQRLKTVVFLQDVKARLEPEGLVAINLIETDDSTESDLEALREAFAQVYVFGVPGTYNLAVIASQNPERISAEELRARAAALDEESEIGFEFAPLVKLLRD